VAALVAGPLGTEDHERVIHEAMAVLTPGGPVVLEAGEGQAEAVAGILAAAGFADIGSRADLAGIPRAIWGRMP